MDPDTIIKVVLFYFYERMNKDLSFVLINWLIDRLIDCLIEWLLDWMIAWLLDWMIAWLNDCLIEWLNDCLMNCFVWFIIWLIGTGRVLFCWLIDWLIDQAKIHYYCRGRLYHAMQFAAVEGIKRFRDIFIHSASFLLNLLRAELLFVRK